MMTPQEKAGVMMFNFYSKISGIKVINLPANLITQMSGDSHFKTAKECALICVEEILKSNPTSPTIEHFNNMLAKLHIEAGKYWNEVESEIEKL